MPPISQKLLLELTGLSQSDLLNNPDNMAKLNKMKEMRPKALWKDYGKKALGCYTVNDLKVECQIYGIAKIPTKKDEIIESLHKVYDEEAQKHHLKRKAEDVPTEEDQPNKRQATEANTSDTAAVPDTVTTVTTVDTTATTATTATTEITNGATKAADGTTVVLNFVLPAHHVSRLVAVPATHSFDKTMEALLGSIGFDFDHLYKAQYNDITIVKGGGFEKADEEGTLGDKKLTELGLQVGDDISVTYDFGEEWSFRILVKDIKPEPSDKHEVIDASKGKPPSQYGGGEDDDDEVDEQEMESEEEEDEDSDAYPSEESESDDG